MILFLLLSMYMMHFTEVERTGVQQIKMQIAIYKRQMSVYPVTPYERKAINKKITALKNDRLFIKYKLYTKPTPIPVNEISS